MIKCIKHGKIRIICRITLDQYNPSGLKALWMILVSLDDTAYDTLITLKLYIPDRRNLQLVEGGLLYCRSREKRRGVYIENNTWQHPYHPEKPISSRGPLGPRDDIGRG
jgi:hypothetical protein